MSFFRINGVDLPYPSTGLEVKRVQFVDSGRNALGQVVAQKINRRVYKFDKLVWKYLTATQWRAVLEEIEKFEGELEFYNNLTGTTQKTKVYWGDASEQVFRINPSTGEVFSYLNCSCNLIDMGYEVTNV